MSTTAQILANRLNAQRSTGPRTPEGKARASKNARMHGFRSRTPSAPPLDDPAFARLLHDLRNSFQPLNPVEDGLVLRFAFATHRLDLCGAAQANILAAASDPIDGLRQAAPLLRHQSAAEMDLQRSLRTLITLRVPPRPHGRPRKNTGICTIEPKFPDPAAGHPQENTRICTNEPNLHDHQPPTATTDAAPAPDPAGPLGKIRAFAPTNPSSALWGGRPRPRQAPRPGSGPPPPRCPPHQAREAL